MCTFPGVPERSDANEAQERGQLLLPFPGVRAQEERQQLVGGARDSVGDGATELEREVTCAPLHPHSSNVTS